MKSLYTTLFLGVLVVCSLANHSSGPLPAPELPSCDLQTCTACNPAAPSKCLACREPTFKIAPTGDRCVLCPGKFCESCDEPFHCVDYDFTDCLVNQLPNVLGSGCFDCDIDNCGHCFTDDYCQQCDFGSLWDPIDGQCYTCPQGCSICDPNPATPTCFECANVNQRPNLAGDDCVNCRVLGCAACDVADQCAQCEDQQFKVSNGNCIFCPGEFCTQCSVANVCDVYDVSPTGCDITMNLAPNKAATGCFDCNIADCTFCSDDGECEECSEPLSPNTLKNGCVSCPAFCESCSDDGVCEVCKKAGQKPNAVGDSCFDCPAEFCDACNIDGVCEDYAHDRCDIGERVNLAGTQCFDCNIADCDHCFFKDRCEQCDADNLKTNSRRTACFECTVDNCMFCSSNEVCEQCEAGYRTQVIEDGSVICIEKLACNVANCNDCAVTANVCSSCATDFILANGRCSPRPIVCNVAECAACATQDNVCTTCKAGFILDAGVCKPRPIVCNVADCVACATRDNVCTTCKAGFILDAGVCKPRPIACNVAYCNRCDVDNVCASCHPGYIIKDGACAVKPIVCNVNNCSSCKVDNYCTQCAAGFTAVDGRCQQVVVSTCAVRNCKTCDADKNYICNECDAGFTRGRGGFFCSK